MNPLKTLNPLLRMNTMNTARKMMFIGFIQAITYEIYFHTSISDFRLTASVPILAVFYYFNRKLNPMATGAVIALFDYVARGLFAHFSSGNFLAGLQAGYPVIFFDLAYGFIFTWVFRDRQSDNLLKWFFGLWACDVLSNTIELIIRLQGDFPQVQNLPNQLLTSGLIRTLIAVVIIILIRYYRVLVHRDSDLEKYKTLLGVISDLKGEIYYMQLNMEHIENVMNDAFELYDQAHDPSVKKMALKISKDVHEIKKNYIRVIKGVEKIGIDSDKAFLLNMSEIVGMLRETLVKEVQHDRIDLDIQFIVEDDLPVRDHYFMMSILRNLVMNSYESIQGKRFNPHMGKLPVIRLNARLEGDVYTIHIHDTGNGIKSEDLAVIFQPGFSTKFSADGTINRGVGLTLVRELVETYFSGSIEVISSQGLYTTFTLKIPTSTLQGGLL